jgi:hypothetical protein
MKGVSGIFIGLILFGIFFTVGANYYLFASQSTLASSQANAARQDALVKSRQENLAVAVVLSGGSTLVVSATNVGGVPASISSIFLADSTGKTINPPGIMGPAGTNFSASQWPLVLNVGANTNAISGCVAGKIGCGIAITGYSYVSGFVFVNVLTGRGNVFSTEYPSPVNGGIGSNALVVTMVASPTPPLTQVFSCTGCVTDTITVYNFALSPVTGVALFPAVPVASVSGTASLSGGTCGAAVPSSTITAYSGSGNAPSITFTCTYDAQTGAVGGFASLSGYAQATLKGVLVSSAQAVSNNIQIGGNPNVPAQGAFSVNFFYFRSSSCTQAAVGNWVPPCVKNPSPFPPSNVQGLPGAAITSVSVNHYVAYYIQVTNNFPSTLAILQYTFLQLDASHPLVVGNETDFWLSGAASTYNAQGFYYPTYTTNPPSLAAYAGNEKTCAESAPSWTPSPNCIDIAFGQTMTLTFAACGYGATNWDWGGSLYASHFDNSAGCASSAPGFASSGSATILTVVISFLYQGQIYTQALQFQGLAVTP